MPVRDKMIAKRTAKNWSQEKLASKIGTSQQNISLIENGKRNPTLKLAKKLEIVLEEKMENLFPDIFLAIETTKCNADNEEDQKPA
ncbi:helix-turn-helix transcriptional regulator [Fuchsiella alkaliacetigena]|uniref:helix-turn-helix transcriptional regulator n=1 Tax=Fuchsiella alkaliacetigena TaxID=957042 RepID=UPI00200A8A17|nr:helix-turn-helix transcriptional regulator [Fuchsiella alkaliacetigena]MCK8824692.1 helix-turn-helix transcriptional regulator [Fuchsiella alkaliacetigena]